MAAVFIAAPLSQPREASRKEMTTLKSGIWLDFAVECARRLAHNHTMNESSSGAASYPLAVIMERTALVNRWVDEKWEAKGVVRDTSAAGSEPRVIVEGEGITQILFSGYRVHLTRDEAEGYFLNLTSPQPKVFVLWRPVDGVARPEMLSVSYGEGTRWADSGEQVDGVPLPAELVPWMADYVEANYRPEPKKQKRYASNKDRGRMGRLE
jgi:hypothetical protein